MEYLNSKERTQICQDDLCDSFKGSQRFKSLTALSSHQVCVERESSHLTVSLTMLLLDLCTSVVIRFNIQPRAYLRITTIFVPDRGKRSQTKSGLLSIRRNYPQGHKVMSSSV